MREKSFFYASAQNNDIIKGKEKVGKALSKNTFTSTGDNEDYIMKLVLFFCFTMQILPFDLKHL